MTRLISGDKKRACSRWVQYALAAMTIAFAAITLRNERRA